MNTEVRADDSFASHPLIQRGDFADPEPHTNSIGFSVHGSGALIALSRLLPMVENLGVEVLTSRSSQTETGWQVALSLRPQAGTLLKSASMQGRFVETLLAIGRGQVDNDGFNRLVTLAELDLRGCMLLRAVAHYLTQINLPFSKSYMEATLCRHPVIAQTIVQLFLVRLDPDRAPDAPCPDSIRATLATLVDRVASLDEDRIMRAYIEVIEAMLRTNFFLEEVWSEPDRCLAFKFEPSRIAAMPKPVPAYEIFVFSPLLEGVHLRGGKVARGGLRWSERMEDYRTEILGLMKAQMVKNAVIVPTGAKGGFVVKQLDPSAPAKVRVEQVRRAYACYIRALLDLTDNRDESGILPPPRVVRHDGDDAYLVVAADKGTATFSDTANAIAQAAGFWLGDAFASGGSQGYDHKRMGITARGAWESSLRLFKELGKDIQSTPFRVVGIGDMSGDVFGNGMLLSRQIRLIAAFNHQHIFIDPSPDPVAAYQERQRLFGLPGSSWQDYCAEAISEGGGVFLRSAKRIPLSPQMRQALGIEGQVDHLDPDSLIRAILRADVDLLWNGGIGTYVRAEHERDSEVGDRTNDALRVTGAELRAKVVVEGGNLGLTQAARVEFARRGGLITTDAVDNSAGVDCSDHEVNIKILLDQLVREGRIDPTRRDRLLEEMTDEVAELVLRNNYQQSKMLSQSNHTAPDFIAQHAQLIQLLEREGRLDRQLERLPDDAEIETRIANRQGLTRPEIAVLLAYTKSLVFEKLVESDIIDDPHITAELYRYFPSRLQQDYADAIAAHPLRREILATQLTNQVMNRMGATFSLRLLEESGVNCARWIRSYTVAREALDVPALISSIESLGLGVSNDAQMDLHLRIHHPLLRATHWVLENADWSQSTEALIELYSDAVAHTRIQLARLQLLANNDTSPLESEIDALEYLYYAFDIADLAQKTWLSPCFIAAEYLSLNLRMELFWLRREVEQLPAYDRWHRKAKQAVVDLIDRSIKRHLCSLVSLANPAAVDEDASPATKAITQFQERIADIRAQPSRHLTMLVYLAQSLTNLNLSDNGVNAT
ncbi:NAD-glutamate dehydrogenase [Marinobacterium sp. D7]|uniref:NAD-glutamate dehydrogenase domain-containing protein n=1 Tax=Marinobacterium ramblicola TaxID=2849041 RepID=UPI001C2D23C6|nr:NAD-glutamate dehydrogenase domain-containing protein [Marinobacterium ramblicola]MBV1789707.1 NAD-glutamate dehydrogenase [Marinobacterium ramblicola]